MVLLGIVLVLLIICSSILFGMYMFLCCENKIKMFADPRYEERIRELEKTVKELKNKEE